MERWYDTPYPFPLISRLTRPHDCSACIKKAKLMEDKIKVETSKETGDDLRSHSIASLRQRAQEHNAAVKHLQEQEAMMIQVYENKESKERKLSDRGSEGETDLEDM